MKGLLCCVMVCVSVVCMLLMMCDLFLILLLRMWVVRFWVCVVLVVVFRFICGVVNMISFCWVRCLLLGLGVLKVLDFRLVCVVGGSLMW